jgi:hypothetical protein
LIHSINHAFTRVGGKLKDPRVHAYRVFRARFNAKSAKDADAYIDIETFGHFLDIGIRILHGDYMDAARGAYRFAHHAGNAAGRSVLAFGEAVTRPQPSSVGTPFFRIFDCNCVSLARLDPKSPYGVPREIHKKMPGRESQTSYDFAYV